MNTIEFNDSFIRTKNFMEGGEKLFESKTYNNVILKYFDYLKSLKICLKDYKLSLNNIRQILSMNFEKEIERLFKSL